MWQQELALGYTNERNKKEKGVEDTMIAKRCMAFNSQRAYAIEQSDIYTWMLFLFQCRYN